MIESRYLGRPVMFPRTTWFRAFMCRLFGHNWVRWHEEAHPRCYDCGISPQEERRA